MATRKQKGPPGPVTQGADFRIWAFRRLYALGDSPPLTSDLSDWSVSSAIS